MSKEKTLGFQIACDHVHQEEMETQISYITRRDALADDIAARFAPLLEAADGLHHRLMEHIDALMDAVAGSQESQRLVEIASVVDAYEKLRWPIA